MDIQIHSRNVTVTSRLEQYIEKKTERLDRYLPTLQEVQVDLAEEPTRSAAHRQIAQITIRDKYGTILRAEERKEDMFASIDGVIDKLHRQINKYRGKRIRRWRRAGRTEAELPMGEPLPLEDIDESVSESKIVRYKQFALQPMSAEEAVEQMELVGHDFFVFFNMDTESVNVLYERRDGTYGIIQPEYG